MLQTTKKPYSRRRKLALVIPAHNEAMVLEKTITSALAAGQPAGDIYVADDGSADATYAIACRLLGTGQALKLQRGGKSRAIKSAISHFKLVEQYQWIHVVDADCAFSPSYMTSFKRNLNRQKHVAAIGFVQSLPGGWISSYRVYEYTFGQSVLRRLQHIFGVIPVMPGPSSCLHSDIIAKLDFDAGTLTEDFDITLQLYRKELGKITYIPDAKIYTQDPKDYSDFVQQITRWYRGYFQGLQRHAIGRRLNRIDMYLFFLTAQALAYTALQLIVIPAVTLVTGNPVWLALALLNDLIIFLLTAVLMAATSRRLDILAAFPLFYVARWTYMLVFCKAFLEVVVLKRFSTGVSTWSTTGRRYLSECLVTNNQKGANNVT